MGKVRSRKQGLSVLLIFALVFSLLPMLVSAEDENGSNPEPTVTFFVYDSVTKEVYEGAHIIVQLEETPGNENDEATEDEHDENGNSEATNDESDGTKQFEETTNDQGLANFEGLVPGDYTYTVTARSYRSSTGEFQISADNKLIINGEEVDRIEVGLRKSSSSGGGSRDDDDQTKHIRASVGGTFTQGGVTVDIPANAFDEDFNITIERLSSTSRLPLADDQHFVSDVFEITKDRSGKFSKSVTITLPYDSSEVDEETQDVSLYWLDEEEEEWVELDNIRVNSSSEKVSGQVDHFTKFAVIATDEQEEEPEEPEEKPEAELSDIAGHWAEANIKELIELGAINGYPDGTFRPNRTVTRAEFAKILVHAFELEAREGNVFLDTANHWARDDIATAAAHDIVRGHNAFTFGPNEEITREQMAVMIARALNLEAKGATATFTDRGNISSWAIDAVHAAVEAEIIEGYPNNSFQPQGKATRAEAVTILVKALKFTR